MDLKDVLVCEIKTELGKIPEEHLTDNQKKLRDYVSVVNMAQTSLDKFLEYKKINSIEKLKGCIDIDCSRCAMEVYRSLFLSHYENPRIEYQATLSSASEKKRINYKHQIICQSQQEEIIFVGETMNSFQTTYSKVKKFIDEELSELLEEFAEKTHDIGNFLPVKQGEFNGPRYALTRDYWDLTLYGIHAHYNGEVTVMTHILINCNDWLRSYDGFGDFIEKNLLAGYVCKGDNKTYRVKNLFAENLENEFIEPTEHIEIVPNGDSARFYDITIERYVKQREIATIEERKAFLRNVCGLIENRRVSVKEALAEHSGLCEKI